MCCRTLPYEVWSVTHPVLWQGLPFSSCSSMECQVRVFVRRTTLLSCASHPLLFLLFLFFLTTALRCRHCLLANRWPLQWALRYCCWRAVLLQIRRAAQRPQTKAHPFQVHRRALLLTAAGKQCVHMRAPATQ